MLDPAAQQLLESLAQAGEGANLFQAGEAMGLDRTQTENLGTALMTDGLLEMVSLSGGVKVTDQGAAMLGGSGGQSPGDLKSLVDDLESAGGLGLAQKVAQDLAADVGALRAQLGRSRPLLPVVRACLEALEDNLKQSPEQKARDLAQRAAELASQK